MGFQNRSSAAAGLLIDAHSSHNLPVIDFIEKWGNLRLKLEAQGRIGGLQ